VAQDALCWGEALARIGAAAVEAEARLGDERTDRQSVLEDLLAVIDAALSSTAGAL
jgi:hypothetical protein